MTREANDHDHPAGQAPGVARTHRDLAGAALAFDLVTEAERLRGESPWREHDRNAVTLVKYSDLRIVFMVMKAGARMQEHHASARISVHTLTGHTRLHLGEVPVDLPAGHLLALEKGIPHDLEAVEESTVLLTIAWQGE